MTDTEQEATTQPSINKGLLAAAAAFAVIVIVGATAMVITATRDDNAPSSTPIATSTVPATTAQLTDASAIAGTTGDIVDGPATRPTEIEFGDDGTYRVRQFGLTLDTGTYTADGTSVTFQSSPSNDVQWFTNDVHLRTVTSCDDIVGEYEASFDSDNLLTLSVVWDECPPRAVVANGLVLRLTE